MGWPVTVKRSPPSRTDQKRWDRGRNLSGGCDLHLQHSRYIGVSRTHLRHMLTAAAVNVIGIAAWLGGTPLARTRQSAFTKLMMAPSPE